MDRRKIIEDVIASRGRLIEDAPPPNADNRTLAAEGGCGVVGLAASFPVAGRHLIPAARQMHNRGNGKGGGIAATGLAAEQMRVSPDILREATLLQIAYLDPSSQAEVEEHNLNPFFDIAQGYRVPTVDDYRDIPGLEMQPPEVWRYFVRVKDDVLARFAEKEGFSELTPRKLEDEFIYQNSFRLNQRFYASLGEQKAFVLSHGRDLLVFKIVGYAEEAAEYYKLDEMQAHVWIAHQRYPTKGRVWHPGGAHPFIGLNEALVHNGDFANYHATCTYLRQRNIVPLFLTDTEVSVLLFDLWDRIYEYPQEVIIEALAPTTERDFTMLPAEKQELYRAIQATHIHAAPDGPWFFIIARSKPNDALWQLLGITDTSMLRPQVFALTETATAEEKLQVGIIASEKQAIDATLHSMHSEDARISPVADRYWNARGGSHTDGGAFAFTVSQTNGDANHRTLTCTNKFGEPVTLPVGQKPYIPTLHGMAEKPPFELADVETWIETGGKGSETAWRVLENSVTSWDYGALDAALQRLLVLGNRGAGERLAVLSLLTRLRDWHCDPGDKRTASVLALVDGTINTLLDATPALNGQRLGRLDWATRGRLHAPRSAEHILVIDITGFPPEGDATASRFLTQAAELGWRRFITYRWRGQRFCGCGLGPNSSGIHIDVYGSSGDYLGSGLDGAEIHVHGSAQDQVGQILNGGKLVIYGDTGQTFMYGAKGGTAYVRGNAAGRPLINAVGSPRVVINGTCLDYLAESFMAGDPLNGGGFVILNAITFDNHGNIIPLKEPYPGSNLFSLASGGAIYIRDPQGVVTEDQLNGGHLMPLTEADWALIKPYLEENARLFNIPVKTLLKVNGESCEPEEVYRKVAAVKLEVLK